MLFKGAVHSPKEAYFLKNPHWRTLTSCEMREGIENLLSFYERGKCLFSDKASVEEDGSRRSVERDPNVHHQLGTRFLTIMQG